MVSVSIDSLGVLWFYSGLITGALLVCLVYICNGMPKGPK